MSQIVFILTCPVTGERCKDSHKTCPEAGYDCWDDGTSRPPDDGMQKQDTVMIVPDQPVEA